MMQHERATKHSENLAGAPGRVDAQKNSPEIPSWAELRKQSDADLLGEVALAGVNFPPDSAQNTRDFSAKDSLSPEISNKAEPDALENLRAIGENMSPESIARDTGAGYELVDSPEGRQDADWREEMGKIKDQIWRELEETYFSIKLAAADDDATPESLRAIANDAPTVAKYMPYPEQIAAAAVGSGSQGEYFQKLWGFADVVRARVAAYTAKPDLAA